MSRLRETEQQERGSQMEDQQFENTLKKVEPQKKSRSGRKSGHR